MTDILSRVFNWHWSQDLPTDYLLHNDGRTLGIGRLATIHPGAFNIAWALLGTPTAKEYKQSVIELRGHDVNVSWLLGAQSLCVHSIVNPKKPGEGDNISHWQPVQRASEVGLGEYFAELTAARRVGILNATGVDIYPYIQNAYRKKLQ